MYRRHSSLGDLTSTLVTAAQVTSDPYFAETVCRLGQLAAIERGAAVTACGKTPAGARGGIGLGKVMPVLRMYVQAQQQPWLYVAGAACVLGLPFLLGMAFARGGRS